VGVVYRSEDYVYSSALDYLRKWTLNNKRIINNLALQVPTSGVLVANEDD